MTRILIFSGTEAFFCQRRLWHVSSYAAIGLSVEKAAAGLSQPQLTSSLRIHARDVFSMNCDLSKDTGAPFKDS
jgi:hypothetical protein